MIQFYVHIKQLKPTEPRKFPYTYDKEGKVTTHDKHPEAWEEVKAWLAYSKEGIDCDCFLEDIRKNGIKYALAINSLGQIIDGNCRYWIARELGIEYLPVNMFYYTGLDLSFFPKRKVKQL